MAAAESCTVAKRMCCNEPKQQPETDLKCENAAQTMTKEERRLWYDFFKGQPFTVNRQKVIGTYIVDFYCAEAGLVVELDGLQHYEANGR